MSDASTPAADGATIWFLTGSQGLYGEDTLKQVAEQSRTIADELGAALPVGLTWQPVLTDPAGIEATMLAANADPRCLGVIAWMHTFSPARMWIHGLDALRKPLLHLHTQANESLPWASIDMDFMNLNQAAHGDREFGYIQARMGVIRKVVAGHVRDPEVVRRVSAWARATRGWAEVRSLRLCRFGDTMRDVAVTEGDRTEAQWRWGVTVNGYAVTDLAAAVHAALDSEVDRLVVEYVDSYDVVAPLRPGGERHDALRYSARIELGLRALLEAAGAKAFTTNFEDLGALRQLPGMAVQRLMADGYGFAGEGDWKTAMLVRTLKAAAGDDPGGTSFMEDYTYHLGPGPQRILGAHMLEVCPSIAAHTPRVEIHPLGIGGREDPVRMVFNAVTGPGVVVGLSDMGDRFRLTANEITLVEPDEPLPHLPVARAVWEPHPNLRTSAEAWILAGAPHHTVLSTVLGVEELDDLAELARTELVIIDADTTIRRFRNELRWNQAYHRLAGAR